MSDLTSERYINLATVRKNGKSVLTPVWFADHNDAVFYCFSAANAGKVKRLRHNHSVRIARCDMRGGNLGQWHDAKAWLVDDSQESNLAYQLIERKYGWQMKLTNLLSRLSGRINNRAVIRIELEDQA